MGLVHAVSEGILRRVPIFSLGAYIPRYHRVTLPFKKRQEIRMGFSISFKRLLVMNNKEIIPKREGKGEKKKKKNV